MQSVVDIARVTAGRHGMFEAEAPVVAMVSGGGDSIALLEMAAAGFLGDVRVQVLHVNHRLRGEESQADEAFVRDACARLGVACRVVEFDVAGFAEAAGLNLEDAGRQVRYRFAAETLDAWCEQLGAPRAHGRIVTGHTRDDRVETFFVRALTGAGPGAFSSIAPVRGDIVRPLLDCERAQVRAWLESRGTAWREDSSNADTERLRALVRAAIVPVAEQVNPAFRETLARSMDLMAADDALLSSMARAFVRDFADVEPGKSIAFDCELMATLERTMARRTVRAGILDTFPEATRLDAAHVEAITDGLTDADFARDLPVGLRAFREYGKMVISRRGTRVPVVAPSLLPVPGIAHMGEVGRITAQLVGPEDISTSPDCATIDADVLAGDLVVDGVSPGDRIRPLGMEGSRKVSDLLVDEKIPRRLRSAVPVVRDGERIVWVAGVRVSDVYRVTLQTTRAVRLAWDRDAEPF